MTEAQPDEEGRGPRFITPVFNPEIAADPSDPGVPDAPAFPWPAPEEADEDLRSLEVLVTPELAEMFLANMRYTRPKKPEKIRDYARMMIARRWKRNGQGIQFEWNAELGRWQMVNGQNRMRAVMQSGLDGVRMLLVFGVEEDSVLTMDTGQRRSLRDMLSVEGESAVSQRETTIIRRLWTWDQKDYLGSRSWRVSEQALYDYGQEHLHEIEPVASDQGYDTKQIRLLTPPAQFGITRIILRRLDAEFADEFLDQLLHPVHDTHPLMAPLRQRVSEVRQQIDVRSDANARIKDPEMARAMIFHVWNTRVNRPPARKLSTRIQMPDCVLHYPEPLKPRDGWREREALDLKTLSNGD
jgi:hypothetical protein